MLFVTRGPSGDHRHPVNTYFVAKLKLLPTASPVTDLLTVCILVSLLLVCCYYQCGGFFFPTFPEEISIMFSNKIVTFGAIYPKQLFVVRCPSFLFSKLVRHLMEPSGYIDCEKCLALKYFF